MVGTWKKSDALTAFLDIDENSRSHQRAMPGRTEGLKRALNKLDPRSRRIIEARWLKETDPATLQELADEYGVSAERIRQIESKALKQMRGAFAMAA